jgi:Flp pilus assembly pilin Flp
MRSGFDRSYARLLLSRWTVGGNVQERISDVVGPAANETGQTATEYAAVVLLVAIVAATALAALNNPFDGLVSDLVDKIASLV